MIEHHDVSLNSEEKIYNSLLNEIQRSIGHCECGRPEDSLEFIKKVLKHINENEDTSNDIDRVDKQKKLESYFYYDSGLMYTFFYMLDKYKLIEHGGSLPACWLETKGKELLENIEKLYQLSKIKVNE